MKKLKTILALIAFMFISNISHSQIASLNGEYRNKNGVTLTIIKHVQGKNFYFEIKCRNGPCDDIQESGTALIESGDRAYFQIPSEELPINFSFQKNKIEIQFPSEYLSMSCEMNYYPNFIKVDN